jgi:hypothetical protein
MAIEDRIIDTMNDKSARKSIFGLVALIDLIILLFCCAIWDRFIFSEGILGYIIFVFFSFWGVFCFFITPHEVNFETKLKLNALAQNKEKLREIVNDVLKNNGAVKDDSGKISDDDLEKIAAAIITKVDNK